MATKRSTTEEAQAAIKAAQETAAEWVELDRLHGWEKNPKRHPDAQVADLMKSIKRFGWGAVILARPNGEIIAGHGRMEAAKRLGLAKVPVRWLNLDPTEAHLLALADNKLTEIGEWDDALVREILEGAKQEGADLTGLGWSEDELSAVLAGSDGTEGLTDPDKIPEVQESATTQPGDLWILGKHRLLCGDSTKGEDVKRLLNGVAPILMVTDPPYGVEYDPEWRMDAGISAKSARMGKVMNDDRADWTEAWRLFPGDVAYVYHADFFASTVQPSLERAGFAIRAQIIWAKDRLALSRGDYHWQHEPCWYAVRDGRKGHRTDDRTQTTLWSIPARDDAGHGHGTQKPVECMERAIRNHQAEEVYEPFSGSGTTLIAAEKLGRRCFGMEISPQYCDVIVRRWQEFTGQQATLEGDGRTFTEVSAARRGT